MAGALRQLGAFAWNSYWHRDTPTVVVPDDPEDEAVPSTPASSPIPPDSQTPEGMVITPTAPPTHGPAKRTRRRREEASEPIRIDLEAPKTFWQRMEGVTDRFNAYFSGYWIFVTGQFERAHSLREVRGWVTELAQSLYRLIFEYWPGEETVREREPVPEPRVAPRMVELHLPRSGVEQVFMRLWEQTLVGPRPAKGQDEFCQVLGSFTYRMAREAAGKQKIDFDDVIGGAFESERQFEQRVQRLFRSVGQGFRLCRWEEIPHERLMALDFASFEAFKGADDPGWNDMDGRQRRGLLRANWRLLTRVDLEEQLGMVDLLTLRSRILETVEGHFSRVIPVILRLEEQGQMSDLQRQQELISWLDGQGLRSRAIPLNDTDQVAREHVGRLIEAHLAAQFARMPDECDRRLGHLVIGQVVPIANDMLRQIVRQVVSPEAIDSYFGQLLEQLNGVAADGGASPSSAHAPTKSTAAPKGLLSRQEHSKLVSLVLELVGNILPELSGVAKLGKGNGLFDRGLKLAQTKYLEPIIDSGLGIILQQDASRRDPRWQTFNPQMLTPMIQQLAEGVGQEPEPVPAPPRSAKPVDVDHLFKHPVPGSTWASVPHRVREALNDLRTKVLKKHPAFLENLIWNILEETLQRIMPIPDADEA